MENYLINLGGSLRNSEIEEHSLVL